MISGIAGLLQALWVIGVVHSRLQGALDLWRRWGDSPLIPLPRMRLGGCTAPTVCFPCCNVGFACRWCRCTPWLTLLMQLFLVYYFEFYGRLRIGELGFVEVGRVRSWQRLWSLASESGMGQWIDLGFHHVWGFVTCPVIDWCGGKLEWGCLYVVKFRGCIQVGQSYWISSILGCNQGEHHEGSGEQERSRVEGNREAGAKDGKKSKGSIVVECLG